MSDKVKELKKAAQAAQAYKYPSHFGSHAKMVNEEATAKLADGHVVCEDEYGAYVTERSRLDDGCADPNRYTEKRLAPFLKTAVKEKKT